MNNPAVSIILPTFNSVATLGRALDSVIAQTTPDWEVIVIDDGSTDATPSVLAHYDRLLGRKLVAIWQENGGPGTARNAGVARARGRFVCFLDADDEFMPTKLARQLELLQRAPQLGFAFSDYAYVDLQNVRHASVFDDLVPFVRRIPTTALGGGLHVCGAELLEAMIGRYVISTITGMVRRDLLTAPIRFPEALRYCEEWIFFLEVARRAPGGYVDEALSLHYHTPGSVSRTDATRNTLHRVRALTHVRAEFPDASPRARGLLAEQLRQCYRQLGMDHFKLEKYDEAARFFRQAAQTRFDFRTACHALESLARHWAQRLASA